MDAEKNAPPSGVGGEALPRAWTGMLRRHGLLNKHGAAPRWARWAIFAFQSRVPGRYGPAKLLRAAVEDFLQRGAADPAVREAFMACWELSKSNAALRQFVLGPGWSAKVREHKRALKQQIAVKKAEEAVRKYARRADLYARLHEKWEMKLARLKRAESEVRRCSDDAAT